jgi:hypothetical protein
MQEVDGAIAGLCQPAAALLQMHKRSRVSRAGATRAPAGSLRTCMPLARGQDAFFGGGNRDAP